MMQAAQFILLYFLYSILCVYVMHVLRFKLITPNWHDDLLLEIKIFITENPEMSGKRGLSFSKKGGRSQLPYFKFTSGRDY